MRSKQQKVSNKRHEYEKRAMLFKNVMEQANGISDSELQSRERLKITAQFGIECIELLMATLITRKLGFDVPWVMPGFYPEEGVKQMADAYYDGFCGTPATKAFFTEVARQDKTWGIFLFLANQFERDTMSRLVDECRKHGW